ncbi:unnamed protein product [Thlaspi arvense]|uniref:Tryptophan synthase beta chain-like PALP domain-containing protein n=1 Tax=Thlaspi arvense TaxID=13288 RepID=A0AAU9RS23_THLAR|nr:unnamed protein product [Thlaspi arvense]
MDLLLSLTDSKIFPNISPPLTPNAMPLCSSEELLSCFSTKSLKDTKLTLQPSKNISSPLVASKTELVLTDLAKGMGGTVKKAYDLLQNTPDAHMLQQFANPANTQIHYDTTEIWEDTLGNVDIFVMGIGSGGTVYGVGQYLKSKNLNVKIYGVEPAESNILNGGKLGPHAITGNGVGFKPDILDMDVMESVLEVIEDAIKMARELALKEGLMVGILFGANTVGAIRLAKMPENKGKLIVTVHASFGERYLSSVLFDELRKEA